MSLGHLIFNFSVFGKYFLTQSNTAIDDEHDSNGNNFVSNKIGRATEQ